MTRSERIFRALLRLYPAPFRAEFGGSMAQLFRDQRRDAARGGWTGLASLWLHTLADVAVTAAREHMERNPIMRPIALIAAGLALGLGIGWLDIHNNEIWTGMLLLLSASFLLGFIEPGSAWRSGLLIGSGMLLVHIGAAATGFSSPCHTGEVCPPASLSPMDLLFLVPPLVGAYIGVGIQALSRTSRGDLIWWGGSALAAVLYGLVSLRSRAPGNAILVVGLLAIMAGFTRPSRVWRWGLALGALAALTHGWGELIYDPPNLALKALVTDIIPAFAGVYVGFGLRRLIDKYLPPRAAEAQPSAG